MKVAIIDLGTNSARLYIYEVKQNSTFSSGQAKRLPAARRVYIERAIVRLGDGLFRSQILQAEALDRTFSALNSFSQALAEHQPQIIRAVATCALRDAQNSQAFLDKAGQLIGQPFEVISGDDEARLITLGVLKRNKQLPQGNFIILDVGGGSSEIIQIASGEMLKACSLPLGAIRGQQQVLHSIPPSLVSGKGITQLRLETRQMLNEYFPEQSFKADIAIGTSGSARALKRVARGAGAQGNHISLDYLEDLIRRMELMDLDQLKAMPQLEPRRADIILSATCIITEVMKYFKVGHLDAVNTSLKDGLLMDILEKQV